jgi:hypothetical protein
VNVTPSYLSPLPFIQSSSVKTETAVFAAGFRVAGSIATQPPCTEVQGMLWLKPPGD